MGPLTRSVRPTRLARWGAIALALSLLAAGAARADEILDGNCLNTVSGGAQNCTANDGPDLTLGINNISEITQGCINNTTSVELVRFRIALQLTTANERYDVGTWINSDGSSAQTGPNGTCSRFALAPVGTQDANACPPWQVGDGDGPYANFDGDACGDIRVRSRAGCDQNASGAPWDDTVYNTLTPSGITVECNEAGTTGFVLVPACTTWGNNANNVDGPDAGSSCDSAAEFGLGTTAKCFCGDEITNIPAPNIALSCSCSPGTVKPGASTTCTVTYDNNANCVESLATSEELRCGTAAYIQYQVDENTSGTGGDIGQFLSNPPATPTEDTGGALPTTTTSQIQWTPRNQNVANSLGIIGDNQDGVLTFQYFVDASTADMTGKTIANVSTYFSNTAPNASGVYASTTLTGAAVVPCVIDVSADATWARVTSFTAARESGQVVLEWETAGEVGTRAFVVERQDPKTGEFVRVTKRPVPAVAQLPGGSYRLVDAGAGPGDSFVYRLVELDSRGGSEVQGPYSVTVRPARGERGTRRQLETAEKAVSPRLLDAAAERERGARRATAAAAKGNGNGNSGDDSAGAVATGRAKVPVTGSGLVRVSLADLAGALGTSTTQLAKDLKLGRVLVSRGGSAVAWQTAAGGDGLVFWAQGLSNQYTDVDVYWLDKSAGATMGSVQAGTSNLTPDASFADTRHFETDAIPAVAATMPVDDFWIWKSLVAGWPGLDRATFTVQVPQPAAGSASLAVQLVGFTALQRAELRLNGTSLGEVTWGQGQATRSVSVPGGVLLDGANQIEVVALQGSQGMWVDSFDLSYPHLFRASGNRLDFRAGQGQAISLAGFGSSDVAVYDLAQPLAPRRLTGLTAQQRVDGTWGVSFAAPRAGAYLAVTQAAVGTGSPQGSTAANLRQPAGGGAEYVVIVPAELRTAAQRLADLRSAQGLSSLVVTVGDVLDNFSYGVYDPLAIRSFLQHATSEWSIAPRYVALAGKGTYDFRNVFGLGTNLVPTSFVATPDGVAASDSTFADFAGTGVPGVALGRIPAVSAAELDAFVDKLAAYEASDGGDWARSALLLADNPDNAGDFAATSEGLAPRLAADFTAARLYYPSGASSGQLASSRAELKAALQAGQGIFNYVGHGALDRLATEGLMVTGDVATLGNGSRLPVMTALTCLVSQFAFPSVSSLGEDLVLQADGGAAAVFGPTWLAHNSDSGELGRWLLPELSAPGSDRLGDRVLRGLAAFAAAGGEPDLLRLYTLLGDPATLSPR